MRILRIKRVLRLYFKRRRQKRYIRILTQRDKAEVTIETAIVFTIIMLLICSMIYFSLFLHDKVAIKSFAYSGLVEAADKDNSKCQELVHMKINKAPTFVIRPSANISEDFNRYKCSISENEHTNMDFINQIITFAMGEQEVEVVKKMPIDKMYLFKAIKDGISK